MCFMFLPSQILLGLSLITSGSALVCYRCIPNKNTSVTITAVGPSRSSSSCTPKPVKCAFANQTYCLSMRLWSSRSTEKTYKACANQHNCVAAHHACEYLRNNSTPEVHRECEALCCEGSLCNLHHDNAVINMVSSRMLLFFVTMVTSLV